jgi:glycosyltransferase involved in cell wall biosynthesis
LSVALDYVLITPARNEAAFIEKTIQSVVAQTVLPKRWVIVSDGSTDGTDDVVERYRRNSPWIELLRLPENGPRSFAAKARVFTAGLERLNGVEYDVIANLDADITFAPDYFEYLLSRFAADPRLGVAGTHYVEGEFHSYGHSYITEDHVNGGVQLFRRRCFEEVGGYQPIPGGGVDWVAVTTARMLGWRTFSFGERVFEHHRKIGTAGTNVLGSRFRYGKKDYFLGGHPLWQVLRAAFQMTKPPYVIGGAALLSGYVWSAVTRAPRPVSDELVRFHRNEQIARLRQLIRARLRLAR